MKYIPECHQIDSNKGEGQKCPPPSHPPRDIYKVQNKGKRGKRLSRRRKKLK
jgi:hypothetical protein